MLRRTDLLAIRVEMLGNSDARNQGRNPQMSSRPWSSGAPVQDANLGSIRDGGLREPLQGATVVLLPGKGSQARQLGDLCYGPADSVLSVWGDTTAFA